MTAQTFLGAAEVSRAGPATLEELQSEVRLGEGITGAGLYSMRELELEGLLRYSFEKSAMRDPELALD